MTALVRRIRRLTHILGYLCGALDLLEGAHGAKTESFTFTRLELEALVDAVDAYRQQLLRQRRES